MKKWLIVIMICVGFSMPVFAEERISGEYNYTVQGDGTAEITKYTGDAEELTVPDELDGYLVTGIGYGAFGRCNSVTSVVLPNSLENIGEFSFAECRKLANIVLPDNLDTIGGYAFYECNSLTSITLPDGLSSIGDCSFALCGLGSIVLPDSISNLGVNPFASCYFLSEFVVSPNHPYLAVIDDALFTKPDKSLVCFLPTLDKGGVDYVIPDGVERIGEYAFQRCYNISSITLPDGVISIDKGAFLCCEYLNNINIPDSVTSIGDGAFVDCISLGSIMLPDSVTNIGEEVFSECEKITITVEPNSYAEQYCKENRLKYNYAY